MFAKTENKDIERLLQTKETDIVNFSKKDLLFVINYVFCLLSEWARRT